MVVSRSSYKQREVNDIMFVLSQDPDKLKFLDIDYGDVKIDTAIKHATKLLYPNGEMDPKLSDYLWWKRKEIMEIPRVSHLYRRKKDIISNWKAIEIIAENLVNDFIFDHPRHQIHESDIKAKKLEFEIILSTHPSYIQNPIMSSEIGTAKIEVAVAVCTQILDEVKRDPNSEFRQLRNENVLKLWDNHQKQLVPRPKHTFQEVYRIVSKYWTHETDQLQLVAYIDRLADYRHQNVTLKIFAVQ